MDGKGSGKNTKKATREISESSFALIRTVDEICKNCGDKSMRASASYLRRALYCGQKLWCGTFLNCCFYYGYKAKDHFRLIAIAVDEDHQGFGFGGMMLTRIIKRCEEAGIHAITLRTHMTGQAVGWWKKQGAVITGSKGADYEMRLNF